MDKKKKRNLLASIGRELWSYEGFQVIVALLIFFVCLYFVINGCTFIGQLLLKVDYIKQKVFSFCDIVHGRETPLLHESHKCIYDSYNIFIIGLITLVAVLIVLVIFVRFSIFMYRTIKLSSLTKYLPLTKEEFDACEFKNISEAFEYFQKFFGFQTITDDWIFSKQETLIREFCEQCKTKWTSEQINEELSEIRKTNKIPFVTKYFDTIELYILYSVI